MNLHVDMLYFSERKAKSKMIEKANSVKTKVSDEVYKLYIILMAIPTQQKFMKNIFITGIISVISKRHMIATFNEIIAKLAKNITDTAKMTIIATTRMIG